LNPAARRCSGAIRVGAKDDDWAPTLVDPAPILVCAVKLDTADVDAMMLAAFK